MARGNGGTQSAEDQRSQALGLPPGSRGRKNRDGSEETIKVQPIKEAVGELMVLYKKMQSATAKYNDARKAVAERSSCSSSSLGKLIKSSAKGNFEDVRRDIEQQSVLFESVGEVAGGGE